MFGFQTKFLRNTETADVIQYEFRKLQPYFITIVTNLRLLSASVRLKV